MREEPYRTNQGESSDSREPNACVREKKHPNRNLLIKPSLKALGKLKF